eukprot:scaffold29504_cov23-Tisochrysis_lutea.AAC.1
MAGGLSRPSFRGDGVARIGRNVSPERVEGEAEVEGRACGKRDGIGAARSGACEEGAHPHVDCSRRLRAVAGAPTNGDAVRLGPVMRPFLRGNETDCWGREGVGISP